ncbi:nucleolar protein dao-5-like [Pseudorasbora parva]|uniref:nucleolar protein dao-5-like n=1 Tax=Pseudorasbora parva TaxID=51549 RepID=UPI00351E06D1
MRGQAANKAAADPPKPASNSVETDKNIDEDKEQTSPTESKETNSQVTATETKSNKRGQVANKAAADPPKPASNSVETDKIIDEDKEQTSPAESKDTNPQVATTETKSNKRGQAANTAGGDPPKPASNSVDADKNIDEDKEQTLPTESKDTNPQVTATETKSNKRGQVANKAAADPPKPASNSVETDKIIDEDKEQTSPTESKDTNPQVATTETKSNKRGQVANKAAADPPKPTLNSVETDKIIDEDKEQTSPAESKDTNPQVATTETKSNKRGQVANKAAADPPKPASNSVETDKIIDEDKEQTSPTESKDTNPQVATTETKSNKRGQVANKAAADPPKPASNSVETDKNINEDKEQTSPTESKDTNPQVATTETKSNKRGQVANKAAADPPKPASNSVETDKIIDEDKEQTLPTESKDTNPQVATTETKSNKRGQVANKAGGDPPKPASNSVETDKNINEDKEQTSTTESKKSNPKALGGGSENPSTSDIKDKTTEEKQDVPTVAKPAKKDEGTHETSVHAIHG